MSQRFVKGRTNQHLSWVMVDATDFATPESALSAATKIKIYGKLRGATGVNFVSSGTGSLTNDIQHVGASALGIYTIALAKADLSDASAAWYDQYIVSLSATGAAYQTLVVDGGIDESGVVSRVLVIQSQASDAYSAIIAPLASMTSDVASAVWAHAIGARVDSRVLVAQSYLSDIRSHVSDLQSDFQSRVPKAVATNSQLSDLHSDLRSYLVVMSGIQSDLYSALSDFQSDFQSRVPKRVATDSQLSDVRSDLRSLMSGITASVSASDMSDIASRVWAEAPATALTSRVLLNLSRVSDIYSLVSDLQSDFQSRVPKRVATDSQLSDLSSDLKSAIAAITASVSASDISDIASAVWANTIGARVDSRVLVAQSYLSDIRSQVSDLQSDFQSRVPKLVATNSQLSALAISSSDLRSFIGAGVPLDASTLSDIRSAITANVATVTASDISDIASAVRAALVSDLSDIYSAAVQTNSRVFVVQSIASDVRSHVSDLQSDFQSRVPKTVATNSQLSDLHSNLRSYLAVMSGVQSDLYSALSDLQSDFQSRVPKRVATDSQLSDLASNLASDLKSFVGAGVPLDASSLSDIRSAITANAPTLSASDISDIASAVAAAVTTITASDISDIASAVRAAIVSDLSDIYSAAQQTNSRALVIQSFASDIYSQVSDLQSDFQSRVPKRVATDSQLSALTSDVLSALAAGVPIDASSLSDIRSAIAAGTLTASAISDIASAVAVEIASNLSDILSGVRQTASRALVVQSNTSDIYSLLSDLQSDFESRVPKRVATDSQLSNVHSDLFSAIGAITVTISASDVSDIASAVVAGLPVATQISDIYSLLSDFQSDFQSRVPKRVATDSQLSDISSDLRSLVSTRAIAGDAMTLTSGERADIAAALLDLADAVETGLTVRGSLRLALAALAGKLSGAPGPTTVFRNVGDTKDRITATVDATGRTAVTTDVT